MSTISTSSRSMWRAIPSLLLCSDSQVSVKQHRGLSGKGRRNQGKMHPQLGCSCRNPLILILSLRNISIYIYALGFRAQSIVACCLQTSIYWKVFQRERGVVREGVDVRSISHQLWLSSFEKRRERLFAIIWFCFICEAFSPPGPLLFFSTEGDLSSY